MEQRGCQENEDYQECKTSNYIKSLKRNCNCLPFNEVTKKQAYKLDMIKFVENINVEHFQEILCTTVKELECVKNLTTKGDDQSRHTDCSKKCSGLFVSSYTKTNRSREDFFLQFNSLLRNYSEYKGSDLTNKAPKLNGTEEQNLFDKLCNLLNLGLDLTWKNDLKIIRISFNTPTFDRITKDRAAKIVDMLSAIGGTMGLLTGFSIISGVEILFYLVKICFQLNNHLD